MQQFCKIEALANVVQHINEQKCNFENLKNTNLSGHIPSAIYHKM